MGVEAARRALRGAPDGRCPTRCGSRRSRLPYLDKTNATTMHAALRLDGDVGGVRLRSVRCAPVSARCAPALGERRVRASVVTADIRTGLPGGPDEAAGGDGAAALLVGDDGDGPVLAELLGVAVVDRGVPRPLAHARATRGRRCGRSASARPATCRSAIEAWEAALKDAGLSRRPGRPPDRHRALHERAATRSRRSSASPAERVVDGLGRRRSATPAPPIPASSSPARSSRPSRARSIALVVLADGADVVMFRTTAAIASTTPAAPVADQVGGGAPITYGKYLAWRRLLPVEPPRRPEPARPSSSAAGRAIDWKFGFVGSRSATTASCTCRRRRSDDRRAPDGRRARHDRHVHRRPARLLAEPADRVRGRRLRRRRPGADRAHRRRPERMSRSAGGSR